MNYTELIASIQTYTQNSEATFVAELPTFVKQAEDRIYHMVQLPALRRSQEGVLTAANRFLSLPTDFISVFSLAVIDAAGDYYFLINKDVNFIREAFRATDTEAQPRYYALWDEDTAGLAPTPAPGVSPAPAYFFQPGSHGAGGANRPGGGNGPAPPFAFLVDGLTLF